MELALFLLLTALGLAYANGANDNAKGVATLLGSGAASYRGALLWATLTTFLGSLAAILISQGLVAAFSGKGLLPASLLGEPTFLISVGFGAAATVLFATRVGLPISTTHALVGGLAGVGLVAGELNAEHLAKVFLLPLLASPLVAALGAAALYPALSRAGNSLGLGPRTCICVGVQVAPDLWPTPSGTALARIATAPVLNLVIDHEESCRVQLGTNVLGVDAGSALRFTHFISAGAVSFSRGLNDTPKIAALLLAGNLLELPTWLSLFAVGTAIAIGGLIGARRVAKTVSYDITSFDERQGLSGNLVTAALVIGASKLGFPVSTTHVSCGALFGIGASTGAARWATIRSILLAWLATLPLAATLGGLSFLALRIAGAS